LRYRVATGEPDVVAQPRNESAPQCCVGQRVSASCNGAFEQRVLELDMRLARRQQFCPQRLPNTDALTLS